MQPVEVTGVDVYLSDGDFEYTVTNVPLHALLGSIYLPSGSTFSPGLEWAESEPTTEFSVTASDDPTKVNLACVVRGLAEWNNDIFHRLAETTTAPFLQFRSIVVLTEWGKGNSLLAILRIAANLGDGIETDWETGSMTRIPRDFLAAPYVEVAAVLFYKDELEATLNRQIVTEKELVFR